MSRAPFNDSVTFSEVVSSHVNGRVVPPLEKLLMFHVTRIIHEDEKVHVVYVLIINYANN